MSKAGIKTLRDASDTLAAITRIYPSRSDTLDLLADPRRGTDYDGNVRSGISDPTPAQAFQLEKWHNLQQQIRDNLVLLSHHAMMLHSLLNRVPSDLDTQAIARQHRCSPPPQQAMESWVREECAELAVTRDGLCGACYQRRHHWQGKQIQGAA